MVRRSLILAVAFVLVVALARAARSAAGLEASPASIQSWIDGFGWTAPAVYVGLLTFRHFLLLPSTLLLAVGGLCFGALAGGVLGAAGVALTGAIEFGLLRTLKPDWLLRRSAAAAGPFVRAVERGTPLAVTLATAVPPTPMSAFHWAAAFTPISFAGFLVFLCIGAAIRSFALSFFGSSLLAADPLRLSLGALVLVVLVGLPLAHPGLRARLLP